MAENIVRHDYNGAIIPQRADGYVLLTAMAKAEGKRTNNYLRSDSTKAYLEALAVDTRISATELIQVFQGGDGEQGTWAHPEVAIDFAQWVSVPFRIWANRTLRSHIEKTAVPAEAPSFSSPTVAQQMGMIESAFRFFDLGNSPRHLQLARDHVANLLSAQPALPGSSELPWQGVAEIAEALGYKPYDVVTVRSPLGRTVAQWSRDELGEEPNIEERIVGGRACKLKVYKRSEDLEAVIHDFMQTRGFNNLSAVS
jgi:hypothetical protein